MLGSVPMDKFLKTNHWHLHLKSIKRFLGCNHLVQPWTYNFHDLSKTLSMDLKLWEQNNEHTINIINPESFGFAVPHLHGVDLGSQCWHFLFAECWTENHRKIIQATCTVANRWQKHDASSSCCFWGAGIQTESFGGLIGFSRGQPEIIKKQLKPPPAPKHKAEHVRLASSQAILRSFAHSEPWPHAGTV